MNVYELVSSTDDPPPEAHHPSSELQTTTLISSNLRANDPPLQESSSRPRQMIIPSYLRLFGAFLVAVLVGSLTSPMFNEATIDTEAEAVNYRRTEESRSQSSSPFHTLRVVFPASPGNDFRHDAEKIVNFLKKKMSNLEVEYIKLEYGDLSMCQRLKKEMVYITTKYPNSTSLVVQRGDFAGAPIACWFDWDVKFGDRNKHFIMTENKFNKEQRVISNLHALLWHISTPEKVADWIAQQLIENGVQLKAAGPEESKPVERKHHGYSGNGPYVPNYLADGNPKINPCENFYEFSCGNYPGARRIAEPKEELEKAVLAFFESKKESTSEIINYLRSFYHSCTATLSDTKLVVQQFKEYTKNAPWPLLDGSSGVKEVPFETMGLDDSFLLDNINENCFLFKNENKCKQFKEILTVTTYQNVNSLAKILGYKINRDQVEEKIRCLLTFVDNTDHNVTSDDFPTCVKDENERAPMKQNFYWLKKFDLFRSFLGPEFAPYRPGKEKMERFKAFSPSELCLKASGQLKLVYDSIFVREKEHEFKDEYKHVEEIFSQLKSKFEEMVRKTTWDTYVKDFTIQAVRDMTLIIGRGVTEVNDAQLDARYTALPKSDNIFEQIAAFSTYTRAKPYPIQQGNSPKYWRTWNKIVVPLTAMKLPFFSRDGTRAFNFGSGGFLLAHELFHLFDGDVENPFTSTDDFLEIRDCLGSQFSLSKDEGINENLDGPRLFDENYPDHAGSRLALETFRTVENEAKEFFQSMSWMMCEEPHSLYDRYLANQRTEEHHAPNVFRVNNMMDNLETFSNTFGCKRKEGTCNFWGRDV